MVQQQITPALFLSCTGYLGYPFENRKRVSVGERETETRRFRKYYFTHTHPTTHSQ